MGFSSAIGTIRGTVVRGILVLAGTALASSAHAIQFEIDYGEGLTGTLNTSMTAGGAWRVQNRKDFLVGKSNLDPGVCPRSDANNSDNLGNGPDGYNSTPGQADSAYDGSGSCQGLFIGDSSIMPLVNSPGAFFPNGDDGNLNYDNGDIVAATLKVTQDVSMSYGDYGFFARWLWFYDDENIDKLDFHPNYITADSVPTGPSTAGTPAIPGIPNAAPPRATWTNGDAVNVPRADGELIRQVGTDFQLLDAYIYGFLPLPGDRELAWKVGRQTTSWGESTLLVLNSINSANPVNVNNFFRVGFTPEEIFTPVASLFGSVGLTDNLSVEAFYQLEWEPFEIPAPGSFLSFADLGTNDLRETIEIQFGGGPEDPLRRGFPVDSGLNGVTNTTTTMVRAPDRLARDDGQYGIAFKYYAESFNNGTEFGFYFMNYHAKLPNVSYISSDLSCGRVYQRPDGTFDPNGAGNGSGTQPEATDTASFGAACPNIPAAQGDNATDNAVPIDTTQIFLEYPEDIQLYGFSFNTTLGDWSLQGEVAYRPNSPLQVDNEDLTFAALGPMLSSCHDVYYDGNQVCTTGSSESNSIDRNGNEVPDTFTLGLGDAPGSARAFPNFVLPYRAGGDLSVMGNNAPNSYIRGFERMQTLQYNLGATYIVGAADNPINASQIIWVFEVGATQVLGMPDLHELQFEAPGTDTHASAGADGTGADGDFLGIARSVHVGPDGLRFNPTQEDPDKYADAFSWGYRIISIIRYESILPGISLEPFLIWSHDVNGTAPGPGENFVEDRKIFIANMSMRYKSALSLNVGWTTFFGGHDTNVLNDRDFVQTFVKYQF